MALIALALLPFPRRLRGWIVLNARGVVALMAFAGLRVRIEGREHLPDGPYLLAAKHESWGDGYVLLAELPDLAPVIGAHVLPGPLKGVLNRAGAIVVDNEGPAARRGRTLLAAAKAARAEGQPILIFPEGGMTPPDAHWPLRPGLGRLREALDWPVLPVATNLGRFWPLAPGPLMRRGTATVRILAPIDRQLAPPAFAVVLAESLATATDELRDEAGPPPPGALLAGSSQL